jgi:hypothetical protein
MYNSIYTQNTELYNTYAFSMCKYDISIDGKVGGVVGRWWFFPNSTTK